MLLWFATAALAVPCPDWFDAVGPLRVHPGHKTHARWTADGPPLPRTGHLVAPLPVIDADTLRVRVDSDDALLALHFRAPELRTVTTGLTPAGAAPGAPAPIQLAGGVELEVRERRPDAVRVRVRGDALELELWVAAASVGVVFRPDEVPEVPPLTDRYTLKPGTALMDDEGRLLGLAAGVVELGVLERDPPRLKLQVADRGIAGVAWLDTEQRGRLSWPGIGRMDSGVPGSGVGYPTNVEAGTVLHDGPHGPVVGRIQRPLRRELTAHPDGGSTLEVGTAWGTARLWFDPTAPRCPRAPD